MSEKQSNKDRIREITAGIEKGIMELFESERYRNYLTTMSRFHRYSLNNVMLIHSQRPDATLVAGFSKWKNSFGRHVKKGEKGIQILAPTPYKIKVDKEKLDPDTKLPMLDDDGNPITEEKEVTIPMFKVVSVFDVAQTEGKPLPQISFSLTGDVAQYEVFMEALRRTSQVPITIEPMEPGMDGYFSLTKQAIFLREGMSQVQTVCAAIHEMAHSRLHNYEKMTELADDGETILVPGEKDRNTEEVEAESISYAVCQYFGIETSENSFGYIATWSQGKELKELRASLETINKTSSELISGIEQNYREICKERGIDLATEPYAQEQPQVPDKAELSKPAPEPEIASQQAQGETAQREGDHVQDTSATVKTVEVSSPAAPESTSSMLPDAPEQALDEYPMPDESLKVADLEACGYLDGDMLPLSRERAVELYDQDLTVYAIVDGGNAEMLFDRAELDTQAPGTVFAVSREEWE
ncbi:MAG: ArdC family protein, partial [Faecousia sp.]